MEIIITVDDDKVLKAINDGWKSEGRPDGLESADLIDSQDIAQWIVPKLDLEDKDIEINR